MQKQGQNHNRAKLSEKQVTGIILMRLKGYEYSEIATKFQIHPTSARDICTGRSWKYIYGLYKGKLDEVIRLKMEEKNKQK